MSKKQKKYRRFIRIQGKVMSSPEFNTQSDADAWYEKMRHEWKFNKFGLAAPVRQKDIPLIEAKFAEFMDDREKEYGKNTTSGEDRNARIHILPELGKIPVNHLTPERIEKLLKRMAVTKKVGDITIQTKASPSTKNKIKALISSFYEYLLREKTPGVSANPIRLMPKHSGPREDGGPKLPKNLLQDQEACLVFMEAAKTIGTHKFAGHCEDHEKVRGRAYVYANLMLNLGPRVSEVIGLRWRDIDFKNKTVTFAWIYERESKSIIQRTKKGKDVERVVPLPEPLAKVLKWYKEISPYIKTDDFILSKPGGGNMNYSTVRQMHNRICKYAETKVSRHGLRHTFGRLFALKNGNMKGLQDILGHASMATTEIYSKLNANHLQGFAKDMAITEDVSLPKFKTNGVKKSHD